MEELKTTSSESKQSYNPIKAGIIGVYITILVIYCFSYIVFLFKLITS
jgi:hypothetical protein